MSLEHDWFPRPLPANVTIGERSWWYSSFACLHYRSRKPHGVRVGRDSGIYHGTFFELGPDGEVEIGDYCTLVGAIICTNSRVVIRDYTFIAHEVIIADRFAAQPLAEPGGPVPVGGGPSEIVIGENAWIGARAILLSGATIGEGAIVGAAAFVDFPVPPYAVVAGNPGRLVGRTR
ncbi:MAG: acyltransferase [Verrucomicrobia bacterium]|nr:acyltransferase [Verrucomicrobiota bacterium]